MGFKPVGAAIIGIGWWSNVIGPAVAKSDKFKLVTCYTRSAEKRLNFASRFGCACEESLEAVLERDDVEAVFLTTPNSAHADGTIAAARAGKHVFVEKPMATTLSDAKRMIKACSDASVVLEVGHGQRRAAGYRKIKALIESGAIGDLIMAEANLSRDGALYLTPDKWRWRRDECPGGPLALLGIHQADVLNYLLGPVTMVSAFIKRLRTRAEIDDAACAIINFESGAIGYLGSNYVSPPLLYLNICGTEANAYFHVETGVYDSSFDSSSQLFVQKKGETKREKIELAPGDIIKEEVEEFAQCIRYNERPETGGHEGLAALAVVCAAAMSARMGRPVNLSQVLGQDSLSSA